MAHTQQPKIRMDKQVDLMSFQRKVPLLLTWAYKGTAVSWSLPQPSLLTAHSIFQLHGPSLLIAEALVSMAEISH